MKQQLFSDRRLSAFSSHHGVPPELMYQSVQRDAHLQPSEAVMYDLGKRGFSFNQIKRLEHLGYNLSKFMPRASKPYPRDARIPPSFDLNGATCYLCECSQHVSWGVAFVYKEDVSVVGVSQERNRYSSKVTLIQIATVDVVLLIPMNPKRLSVPKDLEILFRDPKFFKVGVMIEENLKALWVNFKIDSNSFLELNELLKFCSLTLGYPLTDSRKPLRLQTIARAQGYQEWESVEMKFSHWESRSLSWTQFQYVARNSLMTILVFLGDGLV